jgi:hypothetical protein
LEIVEQLLVFYYRARSLSITRARRKRRARVIDGTQRASISAAS